MATNAAFGQMWGPPCKPDHVDLTDAYTALDMVLKHHNYAPRKGVTGAFNCRHNVNAPSIWSRHAYNPCGYFAFWTGVKVTMATAVDINWDTNPNGPTLVTDIPIECRNDEKAIRTNNGKQVWRLGADYNGNKDAMHREIDCSPADIETGINWSTVVGHTSHPDTTPEEDEMEVFEITDGPDKGKYFLRTGDKYEWISSDGVGAPAIYTELCRLMPKLAHRTIIDNAVVWNFMKNGAEG